MSALVIIGTVSIIVAGLTIYHRLYRSALPKGGPSPGPGGQAQQPDEAATIARTLFVGLAMIESLASYCLVVAHDPHLRQSFLESRDRQGGG